MRLTDRHILSVITAHVDQVTQRARLTLPEIGEAAGCHPITAFRAVKRLEVCGHIKRYRIRGGGKTEFEVLNG